MSDLEPITRAENFWVNEGDLEPITRKEQYIKHLYDETQVVPEYPKTREEYFINKAGEELHDVTIEQLTATENRTYSEEGVAYSPVIVNVPQTTLTTLDVTENGTYTAPSGTAYNEVDVDVPLPDNAYLLKDIPNTPSPIATFTDGAPLPMPKLEVAVEPQQDLHGYDSPWVGGAGKNKLSMTVDGIKRANTSGTWSGNTYSYNGIVYTIELDSDGNIKRLNANGNASARSYFVIASSITIASGNYILNGFVGDTNYTIGKCLYLVKDSAQASPFYCINDNGVSFEADDAISIVWNYGNGSSVSNEKCYPMIRLASVQDASFAPYSNICPIIGWSAVDVTVADDVDNPTTTETITIQLGDTYYGGKLDVVNGVLTVDRVGVDMGTLNWGKSSLEATILFIAISDRKEMSPMMCSKYQYVRDKGFGLDFGTISDSSSSSYTNYIFVRNQDFSGKTATECASILNGTQLVYELATPTTIQLTPTAVKSLLGTNNLWANTGNVVDGQYFSKEV